LVACSKVDNSEIIEITQLYSYFQYDENEKTTKTTEAADAKPEATTKIREREGNKKVGYQLKSVKVYLVTLSHKVRYSVDYPHIILYHTLSIFGCVLES
jgi:hypothetical protein